MRKYSCFSIISCLAFFTIWSCNEPVLFVQSISINGFSQRDTLDFIFPGFEESTGDLVISLRHNRDYQYENLYLKLLSDKLPDCVNTDLFSIQLMDNYGEWIGKCRGTSCALSVPVAKFCSFEAPGKIQVIQYSRDTLLEGITEISLSIKPSTGLK